MPCEMSSGITVADELIRRPTNYKRKRRPAAAADNNGFSSAK